MFCQWTLDELGQFELNTMLTCELYNFGKTKLDNMGNYTFVGDGGERGLNVYILGLRAIFLLDNKYFTLGNTYD